MSEELGRDAQSVSALQRKHANFEHDLQTLSAAVATIRDESAKLQVRSPSGHQYDNLLIAVGIVLFCFVLCATGGVRG